MLVKGFLIPIEEQKLIYLPLNTSPKYSYGITVHLAKDISVS